MDFQTQKLGPGLKKGAPVAQGGTWVTQNRYYPVAHSYRQKVRRFGGPQINGFKTVAVFLKGGQIPPYSSRVKGPPLAQDDAKTYTSPYLTQID